MSKDEELSKDSPMTFWNHIDELAKRLKIVIYTLIASTVTIMVLPANSSFFNNPFEFYDPLVAVILRTVREQVLPPNVRLIGLELSAPIELYVVASFILGLAVTAPVFAFEVYKFIDPALHEHESRDVYPFITSFTILLLLGLFFGYLVLTPLLIRATFPFFTAVGAELLISIMDFYTIVFITTVMTGLLFTFPVFFVALVKYGIIGTDILRKNRKYFYIGWFILTAVITPDGGPIADLILFIPTIILIEIGILFARRYEKKGEVRRVHWFPEEEKCKFCGNAITRGITFCPKCGRSQK